MEPRELPPSVVFDLGNVLINFSLDPFIVFLKAHGATDEGLRELMELAPLLEYESGRATRDEFLAAIGRFAPRAEHLAIATAFKDIFTPNEQMLSFARDLKERCRVFILSNSNELHWEYLVPTFQLQDLVHDLFSSHEVFVMKPHLDIYRLAEERFSLDPSQTLFLDDKPENVEAALRAGWKAKVFTGFDQASTDIDQHLVALR